MQQKKYEIIEKLKGISCLLEAYSTDGAECRWNQEGMLLLNNVLVDCIENLEESE